MTTITMDSVAEPFLPSGCWARVPSRVRQVIDNGRSCGRRHRQGKLTCGRHDRFEAAAILLLEDRHSRDPYENLAHTRPEQALERLESIEEDSVEDGLVWLHRLVDAWVSRGQIEKCKALLEAAGAEPKKLHRDVLVGLLMHSIRGGEPVRIARQRFRERILFPLRDMFGAERAKKILAQIH